MKCIYTYVRSSQIFFFIKLFMSNDVMPPAAAYENNLPCLLHHIYASSGQQVLKCVYFIDQHGKSRMHFLCVISPHVEKLLLVGSSLAAVWFCPPLVSSSHRPGGSNPLSGAIRPAWGAQGKVYSPLAAMLPWLCRKRRQVELDHVPKLKRPCFSY